jgi:hypothetical protein
MSRFTDIVDAIKAVYPTAGATVFLIGEEHLGEHRNWNRIVVHHAAQTAVRGPQQSAGAKGDDWRWTRYLRTTFSIWASTLEQAENRLHALLVAIYDVFGGSADGVSDLQETWYPKGVAGAGRVVDLTCTIGIVVLASDVNVVQADAEPGAGFATTAATGITINPSLEATDAEPGAGNPSLEATDLPPILIEPEP